MTEENIQERRGNPYTLWFVVLSFVLPVVLAYLMFFFGNVTSFTNKGEILDPVVDIADLRLTNEGGDIIPREEFLHKWRFISFVNADCDKACDRRLRDSRQVHKTLGKESYRVLRLIVHLQPATDALNALIAREYPEAQNVYGDRQSILEAFAGKTKLNKNEIYVMDPIGNIMMRFTQDQPIQDFQLDVKKLLKASQIG